MLIIEYSLNFADSKLGESMTHTTLHHSSCKSLHIRWFNKTIIWYYSGKTVSITIAGFKTKYSFKMYLVTSSFLENGAVWTPSQSDITSV